jgi:hypothetical protein
VLVAASCDPSIGRGTSLNKQALSRLDGARHRADRLSCAPAIRTFE